MRQPVTPLQGPTAALLQQSDRLGLLRSAILSLTKVKARDTEPFEHTVARDVMFGSCQKSAWGAPARVPSRVNAYQAKS